MREENVSHGGAEFVEVHYCRVVASSGNCISVRLNAHFHFIAILHSFVFLIICFIIGVLTNPSLFFSLNENNVNRALLKLVLFPYMFQYPLLFDLNFNP